MNKKKILFCGESSHVNSGFGNYTREILYRLYNKYEIAELSCYRTPLVKKTEPWKIYPAAVDQSDKKLYPLYSSSVSNLSGHWIFDYVLLDFKPNIVIDIRDFWNMFYQETSPLRSFYHWMICPTYDSTPQKISTINMFRNADTVLTHTKWAKDDLQNSNVGIQINGIASDSVDPKIFKPLENRTNIRNKFHFNDDIFVIGSVMRNQKRKLLYDLFLVLSKLKKLYINKKIILYLHTSFPDKTSWNIPSMLLELDIYDRVYFTYKCKACGYFRPSVFQGTHSKCDVCGNESTMTNPLNSISQQNLNEIYNMFDLYIQYATCEGFGIPQVEAAACGVPVLSPHHGAMGEVCKKLGGIPINIKNTFREHDIESDRIYPDNDNAVQTISKYINTFYTNKKQYDEIKNITRNNLLNHFSWDMTTQIIEEAIERIDINKIKDWNDPPLVFDTNNVPDIDNNREFVYYIVDNIIKDKSLKYTNYIQEIVFNLDNKYIIANNSFVAYNKTMAIQDLQKYLNNKIIIEKIRTKKETIPSHLHPYLTY